MAAYIQIHANCTWDKSIEVIHGDIENPKRVVMQPDDRLTFVVFEGQKLEIKEIDSTLIA